MTIRQAIFKVQTAHLLILTFLFGGAGTLLVGLQDGLRAAETAVRANLKVIVFVHQSVKDDMAESWAASLLSKDPEIESADFVSKQEALEKAQENPELVKSLILLRENPLPSTVIIRYKDRAWLERPEPAMELRSAPEIQELRWDPEARSLFRGLRQWRVGVMRFSLFAVILMGVWASMGIFRYWALRAPMSSLFAQMGIGFLGGGLSLLMFQMGLHQLGSEGLLVRPSLHSPWPLVAAVLASIATFGWTVADEK